ncbi:hypothetical protein VTL71DRAFT_14291 [Oculimacula yallundae]|uniref:Uncharacterized protein n=1 Tax=Oculimacula yallundae TaxID=86028 RepID=A0ABR4CIR5_9HELO
MNFKITSPPPVAYNLPPKTPMTSSTISPDARRSVTVTRQRADTVSHPSFRYIKIKSLYDGAGISAIDLVDVDGDGEDDCIWGSTKCRSGSYGGWIVGSLLPYIQVESSGEERYWMVLRGRDGG